MTATILVTVQERVGDGIAVGVTIALTMLWSDLLCWKIRRIPD